MALKITLKPGERIVVGGAVVRNGDKKAELFLENEVSLLREKDILAERDADTCAKKIYFTIQLMYIDPENLVAHHNAYWRLVRKLVQAAPSTIVHIDPLSEKLLAGKYYQALKLARKLISYEEEILGRV